MSIFKDSFHPSIQEQLKTRQTAINNRTPQNLTYYNSRNAWIRLSSSVNVYNGKGSPTDTGSYTNDLAKQYILQGGILNNENARSGIGDFSSAYSNVGSDGTPYRLGIRPMPGITSVEVKSLGAYGSLREATVNFQCWDIKQLEDLELLYMRPGYSVLLEWGWSPYLNNKGELVTTVDYTDIIDTKWVKEDLYSQQYARATDGNYTDVKGTKRSVTGFQGNVDSMYGTIKNYSWKARMDGGYDCQTTIISLGEVIESLKVNYAPFDNINKITAAGLLTPNVNGDKAFNISSMNLSGSYSNNILAGLFTELWNIGHQLKGNKDKGDRKVLYDTQYKQYYDIFVKKININSEGDKGSTSTSTVGESDEQVYITLEGLTNILNNYVLLRDKRANKPFTSISVLERGAVNPSPLSGSGYLLALAHPLEISIDPTICLIKSPLYINGLTFTADTGSVDPNQGTPNVKYGSGNYNKTWWEELAKKVIAADSEYIHGTLSKDLVSYVQSSVGSYPGNVEELKEIQRRFIEIKAATVGPDKELGDIKIKISSNKTLKEYSDFYDLIYEGLIELQVDTAIGARNATQQALPNIQIIRKAAKDNPTLIAQAQLEAQKQEIDNNAQKLNENLKNVNFLDRLQRPYFVPTPGKNAWESELGIIGNIYVNVNMLYNLCVDNNLEAQDKKEKNDIALYDFMKNVLAKISSAIGEVNNFDLFIDPVDNVARIIDINYVDRMSATDAYKNAFVLQMQNLNAVVRSYSLESKIFQEQSTIVAIGAQVGGGALGTDTSTLVDFNKKIIDRIIPIKDAPTTNDTSSNQDKIKILNSALSILSQYFGDLSYNFVLDADFNLDKVSDYRNSLKDLINFFKTLGKSKIKNKAIIPTKLSIEMDGIGGIIIGNIFRIPEDILPRGYKGGDVGSKLGYVVTGIGHALKDSDWVTQLDAQTIILDEPTGEYIDFTDLVISVTGGTTTVSVPIDSTNTAPPPASGKGDANAMKIAGNAVFGKNGGVSSRCASYTYNIAKAYKEAIERKIPNGILIPAGGNANDAVYRRNLVALGYDVYPQGTLTKAQLIERISKVTDIGTIINYRSLIPTGGNNYAYIYGHTQIYTGGVISNTAPYSTNTTQTNWASSWSNNYGATNGLVYNNKASDQWECYIFVKK